MEGHLKGVAVLDAKNYILENFGPEGIAKVKAALSQKDCEIIYKEHLLATEWIDVGASTRHLLVFDQVLGNGDGKQARDLVYAVGRQHYKGIYKIIFKMLSPQGILQKMPLIWQRYFDKGRIEMEFPVPKLALAKLFDFPDLPLDHEYLDLPYMEVVLQLAGAKTCSSKHVKCIARGDDHCVTEYQWT
jgi:hypothetical protein